jgi:ABC-type multidrug transport system fused ATPase/permease subunit
MAEIGRFQLSAPPGLRELPVRPRGELAFERVSFRYPQSKSDALSDLSLVMAKGSHVAIIGPSGSGKSTLALLATGLLDPTTGSVLADGVPILADRSSWFARIAYVPQSVFILEDTVRANVTFKPSDRPSDGTSTDLEIWEALEVAQMGDVVRQLPLGLDTPLGENGAALSGGERQRIGIARAVFKRPELLILDEATSALDGRTEARLIIALAKRCAGATILTVAHRASLARVSDRVYWLDRGRLVAEGRYEELLERSSAFRDVLAL